MAVTLQSSSAGLPLDPATVEVGSVSAGVSSAILKEIIVVNTDSSPQTFSIWITPDSVTPALAHLIVSNESVPANDTVILKFSTVMNASDEIHGSASAGSLLSCHASWVEFD